SEAISKFVHSGDTAFLSGMRHGEPSAAIHEIVRQKIDHLSLVYCLGTTPILLVAEGLVDKMFTGTTPQDEKRYYALQRARSMDRYPVYEEYSHYGICMALLAGQMGIPYIPTKSHLGSDMMEYNPNLKEAECPFTGEKIAAVKAVVPDVGIIHVQISDTEGNAQKWGSLGVDRQGISASKTVIVTAEKIVDSDVIRRNPNLTIVPAFRVSAVVEQPWGGYPLHLAGCYNGDSWEFLREIGGKSNLEAYLENFVYGVHDWNDYLKKRAEVKGQDYFSNLEVRNPIFSDPVITGY
ncbi:CoA transferase subunit A, partial [Chloroflexota bacterium]